MDTNFTKEELAILRAIAHNHEVGFQSLLRQGRERLDRLIAQYRQTVPVLNDLKAHGVIINHLDDPLYPEFTEGDFQKSIPILVKWLKQDSLTYHVKASIIRILIQNKIAKEAAFDTILKIYKQENLVYQDERGDQAILSVIIGNALLRWVDDDHSSFIFNLLNGEKFRRDEFLLQSLANFKKPENKKKAAEILMQELQKPNWPNIHIGTIIYTLGKLKATEARNIIEPFTKFPENYKRTIEISPEEHGRITDKEIQSDAKKVIAKFDKIES